ncbi:MAG TPA: molybdopterin-binding protein, partial [Candidatus Binatia bacterium]|nr:molybdopterin-binding protein [Candidatus Binatia bacterium]
MKLNPKLSRRNLLIGALQGASLVLLSGCEKLFDSLSQSKKIQSLLEIAENGSRRAQRLVTPRNKLAKEFDAKDISPKFRANGNPPPITMEYTTDAQNHWTKWR